MRTRIQEELDRRDWTPTKLADESGVPQPTIQRFLSGRHGEPRSATIKKIAKGLGISEAELRGFSQAVTSEEKTATPQKSELYKNPDISRLMPLSSPATQKILKTLEEGINKGKLSEEDIKLLESIAKRIMHD